jgi:hypothetical protein
MRPETEQLGRVFDVRHPETVDLEPSLDAWFAERAKSMGLPIDWESRRWQAAVAAMQGVLADPNTHPRFKNKESNTYWPDDIDEFRRAVAASAIRNADALIAEYRKTEAK